MGVIVTAQESRAAIPYFKRKIKCPRHYLISPTVDVFLREPVPELSGVSDSAVKTFKVRKTRIKRDRFGNKMLDWKKIYEYEKTGKVIQPFISASYAIEHIYDPKHPICHMCRFKCMEGKQRINERSIKRLNG